MPGKIKISKWIVNPVIGLLIALGTRSGIYTYLALLLSAAGIVLYSEQDSLCVLLFTASFTHIFKSVPGTTSFFTVLMLFYVAWNMIRKRPFGRILGEIIALAGYAAVVHFANGMMQITQLLKFAVSLLFLYTAVQNADCEQPRDLFLSYVLGVLISSLLAVSEAFPQTVLYMDANFEADRFCGLHSDPNYYGVNLINALVLVVVLFHRRELPVWLTFVLTGLLIWFCTLTVSKMVFLMLLIPAGMFVYSNFVNRRIWLQALFAGALLTVASLVFAGKIAAFDAILQRFISVDGFDSLMTGRTVKWAEYVRHIFGSVRVVLFGEGWNAPYSLASESVPHNTYIDFLYYLGIVGTAGWTWTVIRIFSLGARRFERKAMNAGLFACIMLMWLSLSELMYFDLPIHLFLAFVVWNIPLKAMREEGPLSLSLKGCRSRKQ